MKRVQVQAYAKINFNLRVVGRQNGFHLLDSVVASIDLSDAISLVKRKDNQVTFRCSEPEIETLAEAKNTAVLAARAFIEKYHTGGVDIKITKGIPIGAGLGGSSADVAGVLVGMKRLYGIAEDVRPIAASLSSDGAYQTVGGFARLSGKGDDAVFYPTKGQFYALMVLPEVQASTAAVFAEYDRGGYTSGDSMTADEAWIALQSLDLPRLAKNVSNDLFLPAAALYPQIKRAYEDVLALGPSGVVMSGAGSAVIALYDSKELVWWAASRLKKKYKCFAVKVIGNPHM